MSFSIFLFLGGVLLLAGYSSCSSRSIISVTSFYSQYPAAGRFAIDIPVNKKGNPEYKYYANLIASNLVAYGFDEVSSFGSANYKMRMNYDIRPTSESYVSSSDSYGNWWGGILGLSSTSVKTTVIEYTATMELVLISTSSKETVFKTSAYTKTSGNLLASVGNCLVQGIFNHFPSPPGRIVVHELNCDGRN